MKNIIKALILINFIILAQGCASDDVENDFTYENLSDTIDGTPFRNRRLDYARVKVDEASSLKIPAGLNGNSIKPRFKLPKGNNNFAKSQVTDAEKNMLPPNYDKKYDINKIINDQISKVAISVVYDKKGALKLVFREPLKISIKLLNSYFKSQPNHFNITSETDKIISGHIISILNIQNNHIYNVKVRKIDELSSLVTVVSVLKQDGETLVDDHINEGVNLLNGVRNALNGKKISAKNIKLSDEVSKQKSASTATKTKGKSSLGGLSGTAGSFGFGSYNNTIKKEKQKQAETTQQADYQGLTNDSSGSSIYDSTAKPQVLNTRDHR